MSRPDHLVLVTGTGTDVGKTWVTVELVRRLRDHGLSVAARKPAQSFAPEDTSTDASLLGDASGVSAEEVCPAHRWYPVPLAPPMAADALGRERIEVGDLIAEISWPEGVAVGFVEGAGGPCSPIAHDGDTLTLAERLHPDLVLLVADPSLGVVSSVRLAAQAFTGHPLLVVLNRYDDTNDVHHRSRDWLQHRVGLTVLTDVAWVADRMTTLFA
ncbi:MAG: dethiobiotin synthase [Acidimicrobiales bacterium]